MAVLCLDRANFMSILGPLQALMQREAESYMRGQWKALGRAKKVGVGWGLGREKLGLLGGGRGPLRSSPQIG